LGALGTARELTQAVSDKVRPLLEKQTGFVDVTVIVSDTEPNRVLALSFWNTREDVQRYEREQFDAALLSRATAPNLGN
jgi:heme-degrading monooxygenase HmoA